MVEAIKFGVPVFGQFDGYVPGQLSETDSYTFNANRGDKLRFYIDGEDDFYLSVNLLDPNNKSLLQGPYQWGLETANLTGTYTLSVNDSFSQGGNYGLTVQKTNRPGNAKAIAFGSTVPVNIENYEEDTFTFVGRANTKISMDVSGGIWPGASLFAPDGSLIESVADYSNATTPIESAATLTQNGTYTILVHNTRGLNETYNLKVSNLGTPQGLRLNGTSGDDYSYSGVDQNSVNGGYGYDTIKGFAGNDHLSGNHGNDRLLGGDGIDELYGGHGNDILFGESGTDKLFGGLGRDILNGGKGNDVLTGDGYNSDGSVSQEQDRFLFDTNRKFQRSDIGVDTIQDFERFSDKIVLDKTTFTSLNSVAGNGFSVTSEFAVVKTDGAASTSQAEIVYNSANGKLFYNPNGAASGYGEGGFFALLTAPTFDAGIPALTRGDFILRA